MSHSRHPGLISQDIGDTSLRSCRRLLIITAVMLEKRSVAEDVAAYGVSRSRLYELLAPYGVEGEATFEPKSRRPHPHRGPIPGTPLS